MVALLYLVAPDKPFMVVHSLEIVGDQVIAERSINGPKVVADWTVTVVPDLTDSPSCHTTPGPKLHQGWSDYEPSEPEKRTMTIDEWVADSRGCADRLAPGHYTMHVTWTPRDGRDPVTKRQTFSVAEMIGDG